ncbi:ribbon-helix-helix protein, CopG family [Candidatus Bathyarchaeota archaeon]|nr:ribbon-helix-helix protein, CopG family [Candidatus Bathyarchaeota archaeon]
MIIQEFAERLTISLPDEVAKRLRQISRESGVKVSTIVLRALGNHIGTKPSQRDVSLRPKVLWGLRGRTYPRAPSPTLRRTRIGNWRTIGPDEIPV